MFRPIYFPHHSRYRRSTMAFRRRSQSQVENAKLCSFSNFNPVALLSFVLSIISIVLLAVALGLDQWSVQNIRRGSLETQLDSSTYKIQGVSSRCIEYVFSNEVLDLNLPSEQLPQNRCISLGELSCNSEQSYLLSGHDSASIVELQNTDSIAKCKTVQTRLLATFSLLIIGIFTKLVALVIMFPTWHRYFFIIGALINLLSSICFGVALGVFLETDPTYAGFFSLNGRPNSGCLGISFGLFVGSFAVSVISSLVGVLAFCYYHIERWRSNKKQR